MRAGVLLAGIAAFLLMTTACRSGTGYSPENNEADMTTDQGLIVRLTLDNAKALQGESVFFTVELSHSLDVPMSIATFAEVNRSLTITLKSSDGKTLTADQMSHSERDGIFMEGPRTAEGASLAPGESLRLRGDLLEWFAELRPGNYKVSVQYRGILRGALSGAVPLTILPVSIEKSSASRCGRQSDITPFTAAWVHSHNGTSSIFYQILSPQLPRNPIHCVKASDTTGSVNFLGAACVTSEENPAGYVYWLDDNNSFFYAKADLLHGKAGEKTSLGFPSQGRPAGSPLCLKDQSLLIPFVTGTKDEFIILTIEPEGGIQKHTYTLDGISMNAALSCFWEYDLRLHVFWHDPGGTKIRYAVLDLNAINDRFNSIKELDAGGPIKHVHAYLDRTIPVKTLRSLYLGKDTDDASRTPHKPRIRLWAVTPGDAGLVFSRMDVQDVISTEQVYIDVKDPANLDVIDSIVTPDYGLALLCTDKKSNLYYAGTMRRAFEPLKKIAKQKISLDDCPALMTGRTRPWVHLRYIAKGKSIKYVRIEPVDEPDPIESADHKD